MARIPDHELERIKREIAVADIARSLGIELKAHGANLIGLCPFHDDHEPSFVVTPANNLWHCMGACQKGGTNIDLMMLARKLSFRQAALALQARPAVPGPALPGPTVPAPALAPAQIAERTARLTPALGARAEDVALLQEVVRFYHETLKESPGALAYLESRGLGSAEMIEHFQIGYANRTLGRNLPETGRPGGEVRARLQQLGILRESGHEHFRGCVVIPVLDEPHTVTEIYGRRIGTDLPAGAPRHLYLRAAARQQWRESGQGNTGRGMWNLDMLMSTREVILCESLIDALTFWCAGFRNVTASYGVEGFTDDHLAAFILYRTERVLIAYDRDAAGDNAAAKLAEKLAVHGIGCFRVEFPKEMDANEYALKVTPAAKSLGVLLRTARWMGSGPAPALTSVSVLGPVEGPEALTIETCSEPAAKTEAQNTAAATSSTGHGAVLSLAAEQSPPSAPEPADIPADIPIEVKADGLVIGFGERHYRIRGLEKNTSWERLAVNLTVWRAPDPLTRHQAHLDLCDGEKRPKFIKAVAAELGVPDEVIKRDLNRLHLKLEEMQTAQINATLKPADKEVALTPGEEAEARALLTAPDLLERIRHAFRRLGIVGEETNLLVTFLVVISRLLKKPLGVIVQSSSAAGKTTLIDAVLACTPPDAALRYSALTAQALFYLTNVVLTHKVLCLREDKGARSGASEPMKLLLSDGELTIASTGKDPATGKLVTHEYRVEGPIALLTTSTAVELDEELQNRCLTLAIDESREQTQRIHRQQRYERTLEGIWEGEERAAIQSVLQNAQRLLKPLPVLNPFAERLGFVEQHLRTRRDHVKYLTLIEAITLLHQHQRPRETSVRGGKRLECVLAAREDVELANQLANEVFGRVLDELSPQTRSLLLQIHRFVSQSAARQHIEPADVRFSRRDVRQYTGWSDFQVKMHLKKLEDMEYVLVHHGKRGQSFVYELLYDGEGQDGSRFMLGLIDPAKLVLSAGERFALPNSQAKKEHGFADKEHRNAEKEHPSSIQVGIKEHPSSIGENMVSALCDKGQNDFAPEMAENAYKGSNPVLSPVEGGNGRVRNRNQSSRLVAAAAGPDEA